MSKTDLPSSKTQAEASEGNAPAFPLATGSEIVASLRADADAWEGCGNAIGFLDADDEKRNAERVAYLRAAAARIEVLEHALRLVADDKVNHEGWATDAQIARHYLAVMSLSPNIADEPRPSPTSTL